MFFFFLGVGGGAFQVGVLFMGLIFIWVLGDCFVSFGFVWFWVWGFRGFLMLFVSFGWGGLVSVGSFVCLDWLSVCVVWCSFVFLVVVGVGLRFACPSVFGLDGFGWRALLFWRGGAWFLLFCGSVGRWVVFLCFVLVVDQSLFSVVCCLCVFGSGFGLFLCGGGTRIFS